MEKKLLRQKRIRTVLRKSTRPRLSVFVSNRHIYAQIINDQKSHTLVSANDKEVQPPGKNTEIAKKIGQLLAQKAKAEKIKEVVFDRGARKYHGRVKALAEGAREGGLIF